MENYSLLMGDSSGDEDGGGVDGGAFRGHFPVPDRDPVPRSWLRDGGGSGRFLVPWLFRIEDLEILVRKYSWNWTKSTPSILESRASKHPRAAEGPRGPDDRVVRRPARPYCVIASSPLRLRLFAYLKVPDLKHRYEKPRYEKPSSLRHREAKIWGTGVSFGTPPGRAPEGFSIDTIAISTAIFINAAVSHEEE
ncbi:hypothetical protein QYE76_045846 [Lolium multiflorum]|uniref:Uncharacterized protein n=1 Tax=Lolium multiflorum TaxID=4521 RepID=A0AAD8TNS1_LOLMU|nr:hypothetical protein QYE76_045846 [Lolium multiflorum]